MQLVIAEKPSVARSIANVIGAYKREDGYLEGSGYIVSWCVGHLIELVQPQAYDERLKKWRMEDLPILPENWLYQVSEGTKKQFFILKKLMARSDVAEIIAATDAGREGELIFRLVYEQAGCRKPIKRLWISSMEDSAIREGFEHLRDGHEFDSLYAAAQARSWADWLVGMNGTRLFTKLYDRKLTVGRVQTPTLAMLVDRQNQINGFQKQKYWNVHLHLDDLEVVKERLFNQNEMAELIEKCRNQTATVTYAKSTEKTISPPKLYDLTTLQREANRYYGYTAQKTLEYTQSLYEKKLVTYPRTDSQFLTEDMVDTVEHMVWMVRKVFNISCQASAEVDIGRVTNNSKVSDHHAIIPTVELEKQEFKELSKGEKDILLLISMRLLMATGAKQRISETEIRVSCGGEEFLAKGKSVLDPGWKEFEDHFRKMKNLTVSKAEKEIPLLSEGQTFVCENVSASQDFTSPPKTFTEDSLLSAMETAGNDSFDEDTEKKGLGTPATRAEMIEKLVRNSYVQRKGKQLIPTEDGMALAQILPEEVKSAKLTADWENALKQIEKGALSKEEFMSGITDMVKELVTKYGVTDGKQDNPFSGGDSTRPQREEIGKCPRCGSSVLEGEKGFYCNKRECSFCLWKENRWLSSMRKKLTKKMAVALLKDGRVHVTGLYSKRKGRCFDADLLMKDDGERVNYSLDFSSKSTAKRKTKG